MHTPNKILKALKELFIQHSQVHSYNTRHKYDLHATPFNTKNYGVVQIHRPPIYRGTDHGIKNSPTTD